MIMLAADSSDPEAVLDRQALGLVSSISLSNESTSLAVTFML